MALYDTRFGLPQAVVDYLNQGLPDIYQSITQPSITPINFDESTSSDDLDKTVAPIIQATRSEGGGGDSYSVYNPDPTRTRTSDQYSPYNYRQAAERNLIGDFYSSGTEAQKLMDSYPDYYTGPQLTGIPGAIQGYMKNSLAGQLLGKAASGIESLLPVNRRAIIENEALGSGFRLNDIGQIVSDGGAAYDPSGLNIMAGYNLAKVDQSTFDKRRERAKNNMTPEGYKEFNKALTAAEEKILGPKGIKSKADLVFDDKSLAKDPTYKNIDQLIKEGLLEGDDDDEYEFDPTDPRQFFKVDPVSRKSAIDQEAAKRNVQREIARRNAIETKAKNERDMQQKIAARKSAVAQEKSNRDAARESAKAAAATRSRDLGSMRGGVGRDGGGGPSSGTGRGATSATSSGLGGLGFSDIRLKENVELIGKSPSNINIYKFNYKNNPTTYQGAMAHEVPWASIKHSNGYMMVDYNLLDVDFKKYNA
jgi:hypothetical protein